MRPAPDRAARGLAQREPASVTETRPPSSPRRSDHLRCPVAIAVAVAVAVAVDVAARLALSDDDGLPLLGRARPTPSTLGLCQQAARPWQSRPREAGPWPPRASQRQTALEQRWQSRWLLQAGLRQSWPTHPLNRAARPRGSDLLPTAREATAPRAIDSPGMRVRRGRWQPLRGRQPEGLACWRLRQGCWQSRRRTGCVMPACRRADPPLTQP